MILSLAPALASVGVATTVAGPQSHQAVTAVEQTGPTDVVTTLSGSGTDQNRYTITNVPELQAIEDDLDATCRLGSDITVSGSKTAFSPIENLSQPFTGTLVGNRHTVQKLTISETNSIRVD